MRVRVITVLYIPSSGHTRKALIQPTLSVLQAWVSGDIEEVHTPYGLLIVNTDGHWHKLPINSFASELAGRVIVGDAILTGGANEDGDLLPFKRAIPRPTGRPVRSI